MDEEANDAEKNGTSCAVEQPFVGFG